MTAIATLTPRDRGAHPRRSAFAATGIIIPEGNDKFDNFAPRDIPFPSRYKLSRCSGDSRPMTSAAATDTVLKGRRHDVEPHRGGARLKGATGI